MGDPWSNELTATSQRRSGTEFAYPTRRSKSSLFRHMVMVVILFATLIEDGAKRVYRLIKRSA
nr:hypothetical protein [Clostridia bacterium]